MEGRPDRGMDDAQKQKLIFIAVAVVVTLLLIISFLNGNKARTQRDAALKEVATLKEDNAKLSQWLEERTREMEKYKKAYEDCKARPKAPAKKTATKKPTSKKTTTKKRTR